MKMLLLSDIHGDIERLKDVLDRSPETDLVAILGDLTDFGPVDLANEVIGVIEDYNKEIVGVPGNCDPDGVEEALSSVSGLVDGSRKKFGEFTFAGLGGSNPTPFNTPRERSEEEIEEVLEELVPDQDNLILISHVPPKGAVDLTQGTHAGSDSVLRVVKKYEPLAVLSGHIHEAQGKTEIGETVIINPGAVKNGDAAVLEINRGIDVRFL
ncbi:MAG: Phosphohydrolase Icc/MPP superfamily [Candidatus Methanohalarchaeum thermophilum]|uniref:Phosphohydrolase Icc/MPP superfamily n=1 Tax=Methanohalarchaeum thermophilum TaxID=1903181 RepID=A0A1Q6DXQ2_METT1|nr:MAG: Phosphohydrolase Icc/MPP superfamily [Candidatus Methanohalarchaeum thermophilum]